MDMFGSLDGKMSLHEMIENDIKDCNEGPDSLIVHGINSSQSNQNDLNISSKELNAVDVTAAFEGHAAPNSSVEDLTAILMNNISAEHPELPPVTTTAPVSSSTTYLFVNPTTGLPVQSLKTFPSNSLLSSNKEQTAGAKHDIELHQVVTASTKSPQAFTSLIKKPLVRHSLSLPVQPSKNSIQPQLQQTTTVKNTTNHQTLTHHLLLSSNLRKLNKASQEPPWPKPVYSYSCLIGMALKNSETGALPVSEIYSFMT